MFKFYVMKCYSNNVGGGDDGVVVFSKIDDDLLLGLELEHLHNESHKWCDLTIISVASSEVIELHGLVNLCLCH